MNEFHRVVLTLHSHKEDAVYSAGHATLDLSPKSYIKELVRIEIPLSGVKQQDKWPLE